MTVKDYALTVNKTVDEILKICQTLGVDIYSEDDVLDDSLIELLNKKMENFDALDEDNSADGSKDSDLDISCPNIYSGINYLKKIETAFSDFSSSFCSISFSGVSLKSAASFISLQSSISGGAGGIDTAEISELRENLEKTRDILIENDLSAEFYFKSLEGDFASDFDGDGVSEYDQSLAEGWLKEKQEEMKRQAEEEFKDKILTDPVFRYETALKTVLSENGFDSIDSMDKQINNLLENVKKLEARKNEIIFGGSTALQQLFNIINTKYSGICVDFDKIASTEVLAYKYTDADGFVQMTYSFDSIPSEYQVQAKSLTYFDLCGSTPIYNTVKSKFDNDMYFSSTEEGFGYVEELSNSEQSELTNINNDLNKYRGQIAELSDKKDSILEIADYIANYVWPVTFQDDYEKKSVNLLGDEISEDINDFKNNITSDSGETSDYSVIRYETIDETVYYGVDVDGDLANNILYSLILGSEDFSLFGKDIACISDKNGDVATIRFSDDMMFNYSYWSTSMTEQQKSIFYYHWNTNGPDAAIKFLNDIAGRLDKQWVNDEMLKDQQYATEHPVAASVESVLTAPFEGIGTIMYSVGQLINNEPIYSSRVYSRGDTMRAQVSTDIRNNQNSISPEFWGFMYDVGMSIADNLYSMALSGGSAAFSGTILGLGSFDNNLNDALSRGLSDPSAVVYAGLMAGVEGLTEAFSVDNLLNLRALGITPDATLLAKIIGSIDSPAFNELFDILKQIDGFTDDIFGSLLLNLDNVTDPSRRLAIKTVLDTIYGAVKQGTGEGGEELASSILGNIVDSIISGNNSAYQLAVDNYISLGYSEADAINLTRQGQLEEMVISYLSGFTSGGITGGGKLTVSNFVDNYITRYIDPSYNNFGVEVANNFRVRNWESAIEMIMKNDNLTYEQRKVVANNAINLLISQNQINSDMQTKLSNIIEQHVDTNNQGGVVSETVVDNEIATNVNESVSGEIADTGVEQVNEDISIQETTSDVTNVVEEQSSAKEQVEVVSETIDSNNNEIVIDENTQTDSEKLDIGLQYFAEESGNQDSSSSNNNEDGMDYADDFYDDGDTDDYVYEGKYEGGKQSLGETLKSAINPYQGRYEYQGKYLNQDSNNNSNNSNYNTDSGIDTAMDAEYEVISDESNQGESIIKSGIAGALTAGMMGNSMGISASGISNSSNGSLNSSTGNSKNSSREQHINEVANSKDNLEHMETINSEEKGNDVSVEQDNASVVDKNNRIKMVRDSIKTLKYEKVSIPNYIKSYLSSNIRKFTYLNTNAITGLNEEIMENGLYHFTDAADKIIESGYIKPSNANKSYNINPFADGKTFFFNGIPNVGAFATNLDAVPIKATAVKIIPNSDIVQSDKLNVRYTDDMAISYNGRFNLDGVKVEKCYFALVVEDGNLVYKQVTEDVYNNYDNSILGSELNKYVSNKGNITAIKGNFLAELAAKNQGNNVVKSLREYIESYSKELAEDYADDFYEVDDIRESVETVNNDLELAFEQVSDSEIAVVDGKEQSDVAVSGDMNSDLNARPSLDYITSMSYKIKKQHAEFDLGKFYRGENDSTGAILVITPQQTIMTSATLTGVDEHGFAVEAVYSQLYDDFRRFDDIPGELWQHKALEKGNIVVQLCSGSDSIIWMPQSVTTSQLQALRQFNEQVKNIVSSDSRFNENPIEFVATSVNSDTDISSSNGIDGLLTEFSDKVDNNIVYSNENQLGLETKTSQDDVVLSENISSGKNLTTEQKQNIVEALKKSFSSYASKYQGSVLQTKVSTFVENISSFIDMCRTEYANDYYSEMNSVDTDVTVDNNSKSQGKFFNQSEIAIVTTLRSVFESSQNLFNKLSMSNIDSNTIVSSINSFMDNIRTFYNTSIQTMQQNISSVRNDLSAKVSILMDKMKSLIDSYSNMSVGEIISDSVIVDFNVMQQDIRYIIETHNSKYSGKSNGLDSLRAFADPKSEYYGKYTIITSKGGAREVLMKYTPEQINEYFKQVEANSSLASSDSIVSSSVELSPVQYMASISKNQIYDHFEGLVSQFIDGRLRGNSRLYEILVNYNSTTKQVVTKSAHNKLMKRLTSIFDGGKYFVQQQGIYFTHFYSKGFNLSSVDHRLYFNAEFDTTYKFLELFADRCEQQGIPFYFKTGYFNFDGKNPVYAPDTLTRSESAVIYASEELITKYTEICRQIKSENPSLEFYNPPVATASIDGWLGYGMQPNEEICNNKGIPKSFNSVRERVINDSINKGINNYLSIYGNYQVSGNITVNDLLIDSLYNHIVDMYGITDVTELNNLRYELSLNKQVYLKSLGQDTYYLQVGKYHSINPIAVKTNFCGQYLKNNSIFNSLAMDAMKEVSIEYGVDPNNFALNTQPGVEYSVQEQVLSPVIESVNTEIDTEVILHDFDFIIENHNLKHFDAQDGLYRLKLFADPNSKDYGNYRIISSNNGARNVLRKYTPEQVSQFLSQYEQQQSSQSVDTNNNNESVDSRSTEKFFNAWASNPEVVKRPELIVKAKENYLKYSSDFISESAYWEAMDYVQRNRIKVKDPVTDRVVELCLSPNDPGLTRALTSQAINNFWSEVDEYTDSSGMVRVNCVHHNPVTFTKFVLGCDYGFKDYGSLGIIGNYNFGRLGDADPNMFKIDGIDFYDQYLNSTGIDFAYKDVSTDRMVFISHDVPRETISMHTGKEINSYVDRLPGGKLPDSTTEVCYDSIKLDDANAASVFVDVTDKAGNYVWRGTLADLRAKFAGIEYSDDMEQRMEFLHIFYGRD